MFYVKLQIQFNSSRIAVKEIAERIERLAQLDEKRRKEREIFELKTNEESKELNYPLIKSHRQSEYDQFRKASKLKSKTGLEGRLESKLLPPFPTQPLPKLPSEYEQVFS